MRRSSRLLGIHRTTVARKLKILSIQARTRHETYLKSLSRNQIHHLQFDEMETFEHTKLKPLSIALSVTKDRAIIDFRVSSMPAKGHLAQKALKKYGRRADGRRMAFRSLFEGMKGIVSETAVFESDQNPHYPAVLKEYFPHASHRTTKGGRAAVVGQGELKKLKWDPLFSLNHTAAMLRANMNRLFRRTWCTTKRPSALIDHINLYVDYHNSHLIRLPLP